jgi:hypothetical protein
MMKSFLKFPLGILLVIAFFSSGHSQQVQVASLASAPNKLNLVKAKQNFTPVNLPLASELLAPRLNGSTKKKTQNSNSKLAYWTACGGNNNVGTCHPCARVTDTYPGAGGAPKCVSCHSCGAGCTDTNPNFAC